jgi:orotate phosphoribosyltransferase
MNTEFIEFLAKSGAVKFGEFVLKSGRISPYFISTGVLSNGSASYELGKHFAKKIHDVFGSSFNAIYGPAYKGIPLAVSTSIALSKEFNLNKGWLFDRKEKKLHGDRGAFVGAELDIDSKVVMVDDVMTTGGTKIEAMEKIQKGLSAEVVGIIIAVDRQELARKKSGVEEFSEETGIPVHSLTNVKDIFTHLLNRELDGKTYVNDELFKTYSEYMKKYGI